MNHFMSILSVFSGTKRFHSQQEYAEKVERALNTKRVLVSFLSPHCGLCASLGDTLEQIQQQGTVEVVRIDSLQSCWGPEILHYNIETIPCFVLLNEKGQAVGKTVSTKHKAAVEQALDSLLSRS